MVFYNTLIYYIITIIILQLYFITDLIYLKRKLFFTNSLKQKKIYPDLFFLIVII
jgi:hypothetical protein